jgi:DNA repair protein RecO (recombination protein O)
MLKKTRGIVLHHIKHTDSGIIVHLYTRELGRQSLLIKGVRNKKSGKHNIHFQPMFILDLEMNYKEIRGLQVMKEFSVSYCPSDIHTNIKKSCVAIFLGEVLNSVLKEESPHEDLFDFIEKSIIYFDSNITGFANFHIAFLAGLSSYLGFEPSPRTNSDNIYFDMLNGIFVPVPPVHGNYAKPEISCMLAAFFSTSYDTIDKIALNGSVRNEILDLLVRYYSLHLPGLKNIKSLEVMKEVFR